ncbi:phosphorothioated DNA-binding restriction endonuclease [Streptomyces sp. CB01373]|uniref:phosphorothioated DNA-binding restriction endonuclease n=1 Tax=Streptomyces sp. CB01373 TaxID=2020325 RepID=UPI000C26F4FE|nr:HNH endonuclease [Streptomyces sp. CB01373]PJM91517.1 restriction endonuclease [Streptomyces sp. CB01373]
MEWVDRVAGMRQWTRDGVRAPHKPLLLLYALGRFQRDPGVELHYSAVEADLKQLLAEYGPSRRTTPAYPFHHLESDKLWEVATNRGEGSPGTGVLALRATEARGRLAAELRAGLQQTPGLLERMARVLLDRHFAPSLHADLCEAVGLELDPPRTEPPTGVAGRRRDAGLRELVLTAYEYQCAFCGYDGRIGAVPVGLEAAHVRWWALDGPDAMDNTLCLCSLHHKLFDKGVLGLAQDDTVMVSQRFVGRSPAALRQVLALSGRPVIGPQPGMPRVAAHHRDWHRQQVFHGVPRPRAADG